MKHFLEISQLSSYQIECLLSRALAFKSKKQSYPSYSTQAVATLFYENSTRTRISFELAAKNLAMQVVNVDLEHSSESKGELLEDTVNTLAAMGIRFFVLRHSQEGLINTLAQHFQNKAQFINAGDGCHAHPSQALLDIMTILEQKPCLDTLKIALVGDIKHSRVANSFQWICKHLNVGELILVAPPQWQPQILHYGRVTTDIKEGLAEADVVMGLRVQKERLLAHEELNLETYRTDFSLTTKNLAFAKQDVMIMHPGPINRGVEIDSEVADGKNSFILQQVQNGVFARMAIFDALVSSSN